MRARLLALVLLLVAAAPAAAHDCATWTGTCSFSDVRALGGAAPGRVHAPADVAIAADGRVAVAEMGAYRGVVLDASGAPMFTAAGEHWVSGVAFGPDGDVWMSRDGHIRRYGRDGTLEQEITERLLRGSAGSQRYARIGGMAIDADGRLFAIADEVLMVYGPDGRFEREITRAAERGFEGDAVIGSDGAGRVLVSNHLAGRIDRLDVNGTVLASLSELPQGFWGAAADLDPDGRLHVSGDTEVWIYDRDLTKVATVPLARPWGTALAVGASAYAIADGQRDRLLRADRAGAPLPSWGTEAGNGLNGPSSVDVAGDGTAVVADTRNHRVVRFRRDGEFDRVLRDFGPEGTEEPLAVALAPGGDVFVTYRSARVERLGPDGAVRASWQVPDARFVRGVAVAPGGDVWVRDLERLLRYSPDGSLLQTLQTGLVSTYAAGNGLAVDDAGNLYAAQPRSIRKLAPDGRVLGELEAQLAEGVEVLPGGIVAVAAQRGVKLMGADGRMIADWGDHDTPVGRLFLPFDVAVDDAARVFVADREGQKVVRFTFRSGAAPPGPSLVPPVVAPLRLAVPRSGVPVRRGVATLRLSCRARRGRCRGELRLDPRSRKARASLTRPWSARARFDVPARGTRRVRVRLGARGQRALRRFRRIRVEARATTRSGATARWSLTLRHRR